MYEDLATAVRAEQPVALATVFEGPVELLGGKLLVRPGASPRCRGRSATRTSTGSSPVTPSASSLPA